MHLVYLGVTRKLLKTWVKGKIPDKISFKDTQLISDKLLRCRKYVPVEFARSTRTLLDLDHFKATEFRLFLLYTGPVVLKGILSPEKYKHFLYLHVAIFILNSDSASVPEWNSYANRLLRLFVSLIPKLYNEKLLVYNVHSLIHLANDCLNFGQLEDFSAFCFENFNNQIKRKVRGQKHALKQAVNRINESLASLTREKYASKASGFVKNKNKYVYKDTLIACDEANCYFLTKKLKIVKVIEIHQDSSNTPVLKCIMYKNLTSHNNYPCESSKLLIFKVKNHHSAQKLVLSLSDLSRKCMFLPLDGHLDYFSCIPLSISLE